MPFYLAKKLMRGYFGLKLCTRPTFSQFQDQEIGEFDVFRERLAMDFEAPKLLEGSSGMDLFGGNHFFIELN